MFEFLNFPTSNDNSAASNTIWAPMALGDRMADAKLQAIAESVVEIFLDSMTNVFGDSIQDDIGPYTVLTRPAPQFAVLNHEANVGDAAIWPPIGKAVNRTSATSTNSRTVLRATNSEKRVARGSNGINMHRVAQSSVRALFNEEDGTSVHQAADWPETLFAADEFTFDPFSEDLPVLSPWSSSSEYLSDTPFFESSSTLTSAVTSPATSIPSNIELPSYLEHECTSPHFGTATRAFEPSLRSSVSSTTAKPSQPMKDISTTPGSTMQQSKISARWHEKANLPALSKGPKIPSWPWSESATATESKNQPTPTSRPKSKSAVSIWLWTNQDTNSLLAHAYSRNYIQPAGVTGGLPALSVVTPEIATLDTNKTNSWYLPLVDAGTPAADFQSHSCVLNEEMDSDGEDMQDQLAMLRFLGIEE